MAATASVLGLCLPALVVGCGGGNGGARVSTAAAHVSTARPEATVTRSTSTRTETAAAPAPPTTAGPVTTSSATTVAAAATTSAESGTPWWVWLLLGVGIVLVIGVAVWLARRSRDGGVSPAERRRRLVAAVETWTAQGWKLTSEDDDSAVLARDGDRVLVTVDASGRISSAALKASDG